MCDIWNVFEKGEFDGVFKFKSSRVNAFSDRWSLGRISDSVIAYVQREVGDFAESDELDRLNFWPAGVWYVRDPWGASVGKDGVHVDFIDIDFLDFRKT